LKETLVIVAEGCPYCEELKKKLPKDKVKILDVTKSLEAAKILQSLQVYRVPLLVTSEKKGDMIEYCVLDEENVKCVETKSEGEGETQ